jgi:hypothetical protein
MTKYKAAWALALALGAAAGSLWADCAEAPPLITSLDIRKCRAVKGGSLITARVLSSRPIPDAEGGEAAPDAPPVPETPTPSKTMPATARIYVENDRAEAACAEFLSTPKQELVLDTPCCDKGGHDAWCRYSVDFLGTDPDERFEDSGGD